MGELGLWLFPVAGLVFDAVNAVVTDSGVVTAGICGDDHDVLLRLLNRPYRWTVSEDFAQKQPDDVAPLSLL